MVAVKVTLWPNTEGLAEELTVVFVLACPTARLKGVLLPSRKFASPT
jgi:hypothetical protein